MSLFSSNKGSTKETGPEIPASFLTTVRTMQDDLDGKPIERASMVRAENAEANPFSPDFHPSETAPVDDQSASTAPAAPTTGPFAAPEAVVVSAAPAVAPGGIALKNTGKKPFSVNTRKVMVGLGIAALALSVLGVLAYFLLFWNRQAAAPMPAEVPEAIVPEAPAAEVPAEPTTPVVPPFAADQPNYLPIDVETATAASIRQTLDEAGVKIIEAKMTGPVEFLVTDKNNTPIAFSRFAFVTDLGLSADLVALIEESFSIFAYDDMGSVRLGLSLSFKDAALATERLTKEEAKLPASLKPFLYGKEQSVAAQSAFRSGSYASQIVRFVNVDEEKNLSLDYMVRGTQWFIGSSKDMLRAIADRVQP